MGTDGIAAAAAPTGRRRRRRQSESTGGLLWLTAGAPVAISLLSLVLSIYSIVEANREPEVWLSAPDVVRVATGETPWFYVQPHLVSAANNDRVAVISRLRLDVLAPDAVTPVTFAWTEQGTWAYEQPTRNLTWMYVADPAPLVVGPSSPQLPICLFEGPSGWRWQPGTYHLTIAAERGANENGLTTPFTITLSVDDAAFLNENARIWIEARTAESGGERSQDSDPTGSS